MTWLKRHRSDKSQMPIAKALRKCGYKVVITSSIGDDFPDLVVGGGGVTVLMECKSEGEKLSDGQRVFAQEWRGGPVCAVWSSEQAIAIMQALRKL